MSVSLKRRSWSNNARWILPRVGPGATLDATIERWFTADFIAANPDFIATVRGWVLANDPESYALCRQVLAFGVVELIRPQPPITHPTLIITCENDSGSTPAMSQSIASEIDGAQVIIAARLAAHGFVRKSVVFCHRAGGIP